MTKRTTDLRKLNASLRRLSSPEAMTAAAHRRLALEAHAMAIACGERVLQAEAAWQLGALRAPIHCPSQALQLLQQAELIFSSNGMPQRAAACKVAAARATCDMGQEYNAIQLARCALTDPALPPDEQAYAHVVIAVCQGRLGELDQALHTLKAQALPLAKACADAAVLARAKWAMGLSYLQLVIHWRGLKDRRSTLGPAANPVVNEPRPSTDLVLAWFDEAQTALPAGQRWAYIELFQLAMLGGCRKPADALRGLSALAAEHVVADPPLAALALICKAELLTYQGRHQEALAAAARGLALVEPLGMVAIVRELLMLRFRVCDATGDAEAAMVALKRYADMQIRSVSTVAPGKAYWPATAGRSDAAVAAVEPRKGEVNPVDRAARYIEEHIGDALTVGDVVAHCGVARRTLEVAFKKSRACTIAAHVKARKLVHVSEQLRYTQRPVGELAALVGYKSPGAFARDFRSHFGLTPSEWKRAQQWQIEGAAAASVSANGVAQPA